MAPDVRRRNNVHVTGSGGPPLVFAHGFGCNQAMWRFVAPAFEADHEVVLYDLTGMGNADTTAYDFGRHGSLQGHAADLLEICDALGLRQVVFVGHSVSAMVGILAAIQRPQLFSRLVLVGPSPCYIDEGGYVGGFKRADIEGLLETLDRNYLGWSRAMAPVIMGTPSRPELTQELTNSFCQQDPRIARHFARVTFLSDNRTDLPLVRVPTLVLQSSQDVIAPDAVGAYVHAKVPGSTFVKLRSTGHCPNLSAPDETVAAIRAFLRA
jgi:sigma-B regulation protein RsbQ